MYIGRNQEIVRRRSERCVSPHADHIHLRSNETTLMWADAPQWRARPAPTAGGPRPGPAVDLRDRVHDTAHREDSRHRLQRQRAAGHGHLQVTSPSACSTSLASLRSTALSRPSDATGPACSATYRHKTPESKRLCRSRGQGLFHTRKLRQSRLTPGRQIQKSRRCPGTIGYRNLPRLAERRISPQPGVLCECTVGCTFIRYVHRSRSWRIDVA